VSCSRSVDAYSRSSRTRTRPSTRATRSPGRSRNLSPSTRSATRQPQAARHGAAGPGGPASCDGRPLSRTSCPAGSANGSLSPGPWHCALTWSSSTRPSRPGRPRPVADPRAARVAAAGDRPHVPVHQPRPGRRPDDLRRGARHARRPDRRERCTGRSSSTTPSTTTPRSCWPRSPAEAWSSGPSAPRDPVLKRESRRACLAVRKRSAERRRDRAADVNTAREGNRAGRLSPLRAGIGSAPWLP
jgi:hypothetical protein